MGVLVRSWSIPGIMLVADGREFGTFRIEAPLGPRVIFE
jgi:hypothetical protein